MKTLILVRHAKARSDIPDISDSERPLHDKGKTVTNSMGELLLKRSFTVDHIISSPAIRALETAEIIMDKMGLSESKKSIDNRIYENTVPDLFNVLHDINDKYNCVMLFGHNPGFTELANTLTYNNSISLGTGEIAIINLKIDKWNLATPGCGNLNHLLEKKDL